MRGTTRKSSSLRLRPLRPVICNQLHADGGPTPVQSIANVAYAAPAYVAYFTSRSKAEHIFTSRPLRSRYGVPTYTETFGDSPHTHLSGNPGAALSSPTVTTFRGNPASWLTIPSDEGLWFAGREMREVLMTQKSNTGLDRDKVRLWIAILGLLKVVGEIVIKVVSYASGNSKLRVQLSAQG